MSKIDRSATHQRARNALVLERLLELVSTNKVDQDVTADAINGAVELMSYEEQFDDVRHPYGRCSDESDWSIDFVQGIDD